MSGDTTEAKTRPASQQKLRKQREKGQVAQTSKMVSLATTALGLGAAIVLLPGIVGSLSDFFETAFRQMNTPVAQSRAPVLDSFADTLIYAIGPIYGAVTATAIALTVIFHKGIPFSVTPLKPDFNRINPAKGLKQMLGKRTWIEVGIGLVQIILWAALSGVIVWVMLQPMLALHSCGLPCAGVVAKTVFSRLVYAGIGFCLIMIGLDMLVQRYLYAQDQRMTKTESKREQKDDSGSPEVRSARNRLRKEAMQEAESRQYAGVAMANMCFFTADNAVAIRYHPQEAPLPRVAVVARGRKAALALRKEIADIGYTELEAAAITDKCLSVRPGAPVPSNIYSDLALGINKLFS